MKKRIYSILLASVIALTSSIGVSAHSGRTDSSGGHHDYKNVSGLGSYHYHHGQPPHLHQNGVCPYNNTNPKKQTTTSTTTTTTTQTYQTSTPVVNVITPSTSTPSYTVSVNSQPTPKQVYDSKKITYSIYTAIINEKEIYLYNVEGEKDYYVAAESLYSYGFDVNWVEDWKTLYISKNKNATVSGEYINKMLFGTCVGSTIQTDYCVRLLYGENNYRCKSYFVQGRLYIPLNELKCLGVEC